MFGDQTDDATPRPIIDKANIAGVNFIGRSPRAVQDDWPAATAGDFGLWRSASRPSVRNKALGPISSCGAEGFNLREGRNQAPHIGNLGDKPLMRLRSIRSLARACWTASSLIAAAAAAQAQEIPVMSIQTETGPLAFAGVPYRNGIRLAIEEANQKGVFGAAKVKLIEVDNAGDKGQAINLANRAIDRERVVLSIGPSATSDSVAVAPIFNEKHTPMLSMATSNEIVAGKPWVFKFGQSPSDISPITAKYVLEKLSIRKVAYVYDRTNESLVEYKNSFRDTLNAAGGSTVAEEAVVTSESNLLPLVTKLKSMDIDAVYMAMYAEQGGNLALQLRQAGLPEKVRLIGQIALVSPRYVAAAGKAAEGTLAASEFYVGMDRPLNKAFEAAYRAKYQSEPDSWAANGYSTGLLAVAALKNAGPNPDREKVRQALANLRDVPIPAGQGLWNHTERRPKFGATVLTVKDGKYVPAP
jgi:branched-chain amino acid transport system substrate-binding protein